MRAVLIASSRRLTSHLALALRAMDISLEHSDSVRNCEHLLASGAYDIIFVDADEIDEPAMEKLNACTSPHSTMKLACISRERLWHIREAIENSFDEFLLKPLDRDELRLRVSRLASNRSASQFASVQETVGDISFNHATREVRCNGLVVDLTPRERSVLIVLLKNKTVAVSKELLADRIFRGNEEVGPAAIETYVHRLRRKLSASSVQIRTVRGLGYVLDIDGERIVHGQTDGG